MGRAHVKFTATLGVHQVVLEVIGHPMTILQQLGQNLSYMYKHIGPASHLELVRSNKQAPARGQSPSTMSQGDDDFNDLLSDVLEDYSRREEAARSEKQEQAHTAASDSTGASSSAGSAGAPKGDLDALADQLADDFLRDLQVMGDGEADVETMVQRLMTSLGQINPDIDSSAPVPEKSASSPNTPATRSAPSNAPRAASEPAASARPGPEAQEPDSFASLLQDLNAASSADQPDLGELDHLVQSLLSQLGGDASADAVDPAAASTSAASAAGGDSSSSDDDGVAGMFNALVSKDVLYPSIQELCDKYPEWLATRGKDLEAKDRGRYEHQHSLLCRARVIFDDPKQTGNDEAQQVFVVLTQMAETGPPPRDLVEELGLELGEDDQPKLPGDLANLLNASGSCSVM
ncbi:uncharacterized protein MONBRDRAFT_31204 [Monosiga brevicollis MX1]|uniref:Peroxin-19 n=1 Tax=Monosiga brevicollis TaxID=81824 RepID=A9USC9_MONBE|nr:uncharacterized protein MONBRDRAFT_31204 [Monosiga brevicollis MX1]EDQ91759.1 predicted protein [Monosiga brevicollis MX1]|eukprot:XP_001743045.1 hypothetical protein [Monosiga brevicollis MX1]